MKILGVDPGQRGALALLEGTDILDVRDMPIFEVSRGRGVKRELDVHGLIVQINSWKPKVCFFEQVGGMEGDSPSSAFSFGRIAGAAEAIVKASGARFEFVPPHVWKRAMGLTGAAKDDSRVKAINMWPDMAQALARKCDEGRAEAMLLAEYGRRKMLEQGVFA